MGRRTENQRRWTVDSTTDVTGTAHTVLTPDNDFGKTFRTRAAAEEYAARRNRDRR